MRRWLPFDCLALNEWPLSCTRVQLLASAGPTCHMPVRTSATCQWEWATAVPRAAAAHVSAAVRDWERAASVQLALNTVQ